MGLGGFGLGSDGSGWSSRRNGWGDPWEDYASLNFPETMTLALRWCEYIFSRGLTYRAAIDRILSYFITDLNISGDDVDDDLKEQWRTFFNDDLDYRNVLHIAGLDGQCYGNGFFSVLPTFKLLALLP